MNIYAIADDAPKRIDLQQFSEELRELSARYDLKLVSLGAVATYETASKGGMYLAMWSTKTDASAPTL